MQADPEIIRFMVALAWGPLAFALYYLLIRNSLPAEGSGNISRTMKDSSASGPGVIFTESSGNISRIMRQRLLGVLLFGLVTAVIIRLLFRGSPADYGAGLIFDRPPPWWIYPLFVLIPVSAYFTASSQWNLAVYPQIRIKTWTPSILLVSSLSWILYLVAYEYFFRGFLLTASVAVMTAWQAIALNCLLYALAHLYKGRHETIGSIPVGILLCYLTLFTGNIWSAVAIHSVMALSNEWFSIRAHPGMQFRKGKNIP